MVAKKRTEQGDNLNGQPPKPHDKAVTKVLGFKFSLIYIWHVILHFLKQIS
jgi:hypothetical protein